MSNEDILLDLVSAEWRQVGRGHDWKPVDKCLLPLQDLPVVCSPKCPTIVKVQIELKDELKEKHRVGWTSWSWLARKHPLRFRVRVVDLTGAWAQSILEFVNPEWKIEEIDSPLDSKIDLLRVYCDDADVTMSRTIVHIKKCPLDGSTSSSTLKRKIFEINRIEYDGQKLQKIIWKASKSNNTEVSLDIGNLHDKKSSDKELLKQGVDNKVRWQAYALVDLNCLSVYGVRVVMQSPTAAVVTGCLLPLVENETLSTEGRAIMPSLSESITINDITLTTSGLEPFEPFLDEPEQEEASDSLPSIIASVSALTVETSTARLEQKLDELGSKIDALNLNFEKLLIFLSKRG